jgi:hypothetical protein
MCSPDIPLPARSSTSAAIEGGVNPCPVLLVELIIHERVKR